MASNGEVEGPDDHVSQARLARNIDRVQPRPTTSASRPPPTIVRRTAPPNETRHHHLPRGHHHGHHDDLKPTRHRRLNHPVRYLRCDLCAVETTAQSPLEPN